MQAPSRALEANECSEDTIPFKAQTFEGRRQSSEIAEALIANENNPAILYDGGCHKTQLARVISFYRARSYEVAGVKLTYSEGAYKNFQGTYLKVIQTAKLSFEQTSNANRPALTDYSSCKTIAFRWM